MAHFENKELGASFDVPDSLTVRQQLAYTSEATHSKSAELWECYWRAALVVMQNWQCDLLPEVNVDLDKVTNPKVARLMLWVGSEVYVHINALGDVPKG